MTLRFPTWSSASYAKCIVSLVLVCGNVSYAHAGDETLTTADFGVITSEIEKTVEKYGRESTCVVFDFDNTLLAMDSDLGSDQWFEWQNGLLKTAPNSEYLVANNFDGLLRVQGVIFSLSRMHPPEERIPEFIEKIQAKCDSMIVMTARGDAFRSDTIDELRRCKVDFARSAIPITEVRGSFFPFDPAAPETRGLSSAQVAAFGLTELRTVSYSDGVYMVQGQHRGAMLKCLLGRSERKYKAIVHVDDQSKYSQQIVELLGNSYAVRGLTYTRESGRMARFRSSDKSTVISQWRGLEHVIKNTFDNALD
ncbi:MAG: DUF2608 domain-containing protein [Planctomycetota bacterium]